MISRALVSLMLAVTLMLGLVSSALADTFGAPAGNETTASAGFTQVVGGLEYSWSLFARRDTVAGDSVVSASYDNFSEMTCHGGAQDGQPGFRFISFYGEANVPFVVAGKLAAAVAGARVHGIEDTYDSCTESDTTKEKTVSFGFALHATSGPTPVGTQQCVDFSDAGDSPMLLTLTGTSRTAAGVAVVNGRRFSISDGGIAHQQWNSVPDPSCAV